MDGFMKVLVILAVVFQGVYSACERSEIAACLPDTLYDRDAGYIRGGISRIMMKYYCSKLDGYIRCLNINCGISALDTTELLESKIRPNCKEYTANIADTQDTKEAAKDMEDNDKDTEDTAKDTAETYESNFHSHSRDHTTSYVPMIVGISCGLLVLKIVFIGLLCYYRRRRTILIVRQGQHFNNPLRNA